MTSSPSAASPTTSSDAHVIVHPDKEELARATAMRLVEAVTRAQTDRGTASIVLTGGGLGIAVLEAVAELPEGSPVDWRQVDIWWGDERFVPADDPQRNELQARRALLDSLDLDPVRVHPMPASDGADGDDVDEAAARHADELLVAGGGAAPQFDVLLLGMGPDGHIASLFPGLPAVHDERPAVGVQGSPKPPPTRISMTYPTICRAREVWFVVAGPDKAEPVAAALGGAKPQEVPAAGAYGTERTLWMLDADAAALRASMSGQDI